MPRDRGETGQGLHGGAVPGTLDSGDPVTKAAYLLVNQGVSVLPVVDGELLIGVVRLIDVFKEAARVVLHD